MSYWWKLYFHLLQELPKESAILERVKERAVAEDPSHEFQDWLDAKSQCKKLVRLVWNADSDDDRKILSLALYYWVRVAGYVEHGANGEGAEWVIFEDIIEFPHYKQHDKFRERFKFYPGIIKRFDN